MKRTSRLLATATASLLLGVDAVPSTFHTAFAQATSENDDAWKKDPNVTKAAEDIYSWLEGTRKETAKTKADIARHFPKLKPEVIDNALKRLTIYEAVIHQTGSGTTRDPYRFYEYEVHRGSVGG